MRKTGWAVPYAFTVANLFCGFLAIAYGLNEKCIAASWLIIVAALMDGLDGKIARFTGASTRFGVEFDSMADLVSFGIAPTVLLYKHTFWHVGLWGWCLVFLYVFAGAFRLARFNYQYKGIRKDFFHGLPITMAGMTIAAFIIFFASFKSDTIITILLITTTVLLSILMLSTLRYEGLPRFSLETRKDKIKIGVLLCSVVAIAIKPSLVLFPLMVTYLLLGPIEWVCDVIRVQSPFRSIIDTEKTTKRDSYVS